MFTPLRLEAQKQNTWYVGGLHFECVGCGNCCAGPEEGYIWICGKEIQMLAEYLHLTVDQVRQKYLRRYGMRNSIREERRTKDCMFLVPTAEGRGCAIYPVRPNQCRTWPFWAANLKHPDNWNQAAVKCPGINRGRYYSFEEIEAILKQKQWWDGDA